ncbi:MAG TPA: NEW3 domain-containing protein [Gemmataceae bacterium]|nr:NEW3 domain-containing protein [Gemmataceae bacterium]
MSLLFLLTTALAAPAADLGEGTDLEIGGPGKGRGKFQQMADLTFDAKNQLHVLDGVRWEKGALVGNGLVQRFDDEGKFLAEFSVIDPKLGDRNAPAHLAVDGKGRVHVTQPRAGLVQQYGPDGKLLRNYTVPAAHAVTVRTVRGKEQVVVVPNEYKDNKPVEVAALTLLDPEGDGTTALKLSRPVSNCQAIAADAAGNLYLQANLNQIYKFDPGGKLLHVLGGGTLRVADGSELLATVAVDSKGNVYGNTFGNPSHISRFDPSFSKVTQREGQFAWADAWGEQSLFAIDRHDRLWVAALGNTPGNEKYHYRPCVMRLEASFFDPKRPTVTTHGTELLGLHLAVESALPYGIAYDFAAASFDFVVKASNRQVRALDVRWFVHDVWKNEIAKGTFPLPLRDGAEARHAVEFTPPRYGWYTVTFEAWQGDRFLAAVGKHLGVTPKFPGMPVLAAGESPGGWDDAPRQAFAGLPLMRVHVGGGPDKLDKDVEQAAKHGLTLLVQFENKQQCDPKSVREVVTRFKGRVKYWEVMNEPNFFMKPEEYVAVLKELYPLIKGIDPQAQVLGPTVCGIQLPWYEAFYKLGGKELTDVLSIHDFEGNEAIDPGHWIWEIGELRKIMARHGDADKPVWQTERAIGGVRAENFQGGVQAVRVTLQRDVLESLGIPAEHNLHYYLNQGGYGTVPTYVWSDAGPHPAALATRTRQATIRKRPFAGKLDFGPTGNKFLFGLRYDGRDGSTITLRSLGSRSQRLQLSVKGGSTLVAVDSFGNESRLPIHQGKATVMISTLPVYLRLAKGQEIRLPHTDFGRNYASQATFTYSAESSGNLEALTNGILEAPHPDDSHREPWSGSLPSLPQTLEMRFPHPRAVERLLLFGVRADNPYCTLLDYDVQYHDGKDWVTLEEVRSPMPESNVVSTPQCRANTWYMDENIFKHHFKPVTTERLRLVVRRTTHGFMPDEVAVKAAGWSANAPHLMLREVEVYGPTPEVSVSFPERVRTRTEAFAREPVTVSVANQSSASKKGRVAVAVPQGWKAAPAELPVEVAAGGMKDFTFDLIPPAGAIDVGPIDATATFHDDKGTILDFDRLTLQVIAPVTVNPVSPGKIDRDHQELPIGLKNVSDKPVRGSVRVELTPLGGVFRFVLTETAFGPIDPGLGVTAQVAVSGVDLTASGWKATYTVTANGLVVTTKRELAQVRRWQVLGPFPNLTGRAFDKDFGPEKGVDLSASYPGHGGEMVRWKAAQSSTTGFVDLNPLFKPNILVCAYAVIYVKSPDARKALVSAGSDDGGKTWLNGKEILSVPGARSAAPGQDRVPVELKAGWNEVLIKIPQSHGGWGFYFDLLTPDGKPMADLVYSPSREK